MTGCFRISSILIPLCSHHRKLDSVSVCILNLKSHISPGSNQLDLETQEPWVPAILSGNMETRSGCHFCSAWEMQEWTALKWFEEIHQRSRNAFPLKWKSSSAPGAPRFLAKAVSWEPPGGNPQAGQRWAHCACQRIIGLPSCNSRWEPSLAYVSGCDSQNPEVQSPQACWVSRQEEEELDLSFIKRVSWQHGIWVLCWKSTN